MQDSGVRRPSAGGVTQRTIYKNTCIYARLQTNDLIFRLVILTAIGGQLAHSCSTLFHHRQVSYSARKYWLLTTSGISHYKALPNNTDTQVVIMVIRLSLTANCWLFMITNIGKFSSHTSFMCIVEEVKLLVKSWINENNFWDWQLKHIED